MRDRPPRSSIRLEVDDSAGDGKGRQIVEDDVEAHARRHAVGGRRPQIDGAESVARQEHDVVLGLDFGIAVRRHRVQRAGLVDHVIARQAVVAARRGKQKALDPGFLREFGDMHAAAMIDVVCDVRVEVAERDRWTTPRGE